MLATPEHYLPRKNNSPSEEYILVKSDKTENEHRSSFAYFQFLFLFKIGWACIETIS
jgi:hypothetical protein